MHTKRYEETYDGRITYFNVPTQVRFWDGEEYVGGIGVEDYIICGCCGGKVDLEEVYLEAPKRGCIITIYDDWNDISAFIIG